MDHKSLDAAQSGSHSPATGKGKGALALELGRSGPRLLTRIQPKKGEAIPWKARSSVSSQLVRSAGLCPRCGERVIRTACKVY